MYPQLRDETRITHYQEQSKMKDKWLTVNEICEYLNVTNETVYRWIEQSGMPGHRVGRRWMFKQVEVDQWVRDGKAAANEDNEE